MDQLPKYTSYKFTNVVDINDIIAKGPAHFLDCNFEGLDLTKVDLSYCIFDHGCSLSKSKLGNLIYSEFYGVDMSGADFSKADVSWAYAINCDITRVNMRGMRMTLDCFFFNGVKSSSESDGWKLCWWSTLFDTPARNRIRAFIPSKYKTLMSKFFQVGFRPKK